MTLVLVQNVSSQSGFINLIFPHFDLKCLIFGILGSKLENKLPYNSNYKLM